MRHSASMSQKLGMYGVNMHKYISKQYQMVEIISGIEISNM